MIISFRCAETQAVFEGRRSRKFASIRIILERKLAILDAAVTLGDLRSPPGNRLEPLKGDRAGEYSIRVNDQYRLCFWWTAQGPTGVECTDYH